MDVEFSSEDLDRLETDADFDAKLPAAVVKAFRKVLTWIRQAADERDLYQMKSLRMEKLRDPRRDGQHPMRLNDQYRLIVSISKRRGRSNVIVLLGIEDYH